MPGTKMMGYKKGGSLDMVEKDGKKVPFYAADGKGKMAEGGKVKKKKVKKKKMNVPGKLGSKTVQERAAKAPMPTAPNNTSAPLPKPQAPAAPAGGAPKPPMGGGMPPMGGAPAPAGGMGMPPKPPMPGMKAGGKVKKKSSTYKKGGKVRGCGIAKKGVRPAKMR